MSIDDLRTTCKNAIAAGHSAVVLATPPRWPRPKGFPRGELMCVNSERERVYRFDAKKLLRWAEAA